VIALFLLLYTTDEDIKTSYSWTHDGRFCWHTQLCFETFETPYTWSGLSSWPAYPSVNVSLCIFIAHLVERLTHTCWCQAVNFVRKWFEQDVGAWWTFYYTNLRLGYKFFSPEYKNKNFKDDENFWTNRNWGRSFCYLVL